MNISGLESYIANGLTSVFGESVYLLLFALIIFAILFGTQRFPLALWVFFSIPLLFLLFVQAVILPAYVINGAVLILALLGGWILARMVV